MSHFSVFCIVAASFGLNNTVPQGSYGQGILSESGKVRENRESQGKVREF